MAPYNHFEDTHAPLAAIAEQGFAIPEKRLAANRPEFDGREEDVIPEIGWAYVTFGIENPRHSRIMFPCFSDEENKAPDLPKISDRAFAHLAEPIAIGQSRGLIKGEDPKIAAMAAWSIVHALATIYNEEQVTGNELDGRDMEDLTRDS